MTNFDFFSDLGKKNRMPPGSVAPKPAGWKGRQTKRTQELVKTLTPETLQIVDDLRPITVSATPHRKSFRRSLTKRQQGFAHYLVQGYSKRQALLKAGYAQKTADHWDYNKGSIKTVLTYLESMKEKLRAQGITDEYIATKFKDWFEAKTYVGKEGTEVADAKAQMMAYDRYEKIVNPQKATPEGMIKHREISLSEWIKEP